MRWPDIVVTADQPAGVQTSHPSAASRILLSVVEKRLHASPHHSPRMCFEMFADFLRKLTSPCPNEGRVCLPRYQNRKIRKFTIGKYPSRAITFFFFLQQNLFESGNFPPCIKINLKKSKFQEVAVALNENLRKFSDLPYEGS